MNKIEARGTRPDARIRCANAEALASIFEPRPSGIVPREKEVCV